MQVSLLFLVAGYQHYDRFGDLNAEGLRIHFEINAIGPLLMVQAVRPILGKGAKVMLCPCSPGYASMLIASPDSNTESHDYKAVQELPQEGPEVMSCPHNEGTNSKCC